MRNYIYIYFLRVEDMKIRIPLQWVLPAPESAVCLEVP